MRRTWSSLLMFSAARTWCVDLHGGGLEESQPQQAQLWGSLQLQPHLRLKCIRKWRSAKQFESKIIKSCAECWVTSNLVIPSEYWVEEEEEKQKLIQKYKEAMSKKACRYSDEGRGSCPFGGNCFYKHAYPDGRRVEPQRQKVGTSSRYQAQRRSHFWELIERENNLFDKEEEEVVTFELGEMLLTLLAVGGDDELTDSEDEWDLFHKELEDIYDLDL